MNADETVKALKCCSRTDAHSSGCDSCPYEYCGDDCNSLCKIAADLIESLQAQLADYPHMDQLVNGKMAENQRLRQINEKLQSQLAESQRREQAAVEDLKMVCISGEPCTSCKECRNMGDRFPCALGEWCGGTKWQWRGPQEAGEGETE